ncbi:Tetrapyrrole methylase family protein (MazG family protein) [Desulfamplus magnetovallimortis]|uniref:Tetrapyrrole methylase family protein (MazG family protein) n=1 Tax=Desulfamplus magnetovallimortis TaxID=1246637 RepID=A0A1W1H983_9BACT|nr:nucleoside triphosphate pyrophosphohydrolase [Desulfamplus magnetovallimortis]SLM29022.1 Tetrapyrrole methylase family protein (MazG family protein) [Desulfamplus magnetovallimortis]
MQQICDEKQKSDDKMGNLNTIIEIIQRLRGENGCPWDRKQTPKTMWKCLAEEMYELLSAIEGDEPEEICDELGDVLFQLVFIAEIYREKGTFDIGKSIAKSAAKMIRRHPHIYGDKTLKNEQELWNRWERIKNEEKKEAGKKKPESLLDSVPAGMPSLMRAYKVSERAVRAGFDWKDMEEVTTKAFEEWKEFADALENGKSEDIAMEFGDILFTLTNVARLAGVHPEVALAGSTEKFEKRFRYMEHQLGINGQSLKDVPRQELEVLWDMAKKNI